MVSPSAWGCHTSLGDSGLSAPQICFAGRVVGPSKELRCAEMLAGVRLRGTNLGPVLLPGRDGDQPGRTPKLNPFWMEVANGG